MSGANSFLAPNVYLCSQIIKPNYYEIKINITN